MIKHLVKCLVSQSPTLQAGAEKKPDLPRWQTIQDLSTSYGSIKCQMLAIYGSTNSHVLAIYGPRRCQLLKIYFSFLFLSKPNSTSTQLSSTQVGVTTLLLSYPPTTTKTFKVLPGNIGN
jgi:hypothetical protein